MRNVYEWWTKGWINVGITKSKAWDYRNDLWKTKGDASNNLRSDQMYNRCVFICYGFTDDTTQ